MREDVTAPLGSDTTPTGARISGARGIAYNDTGFVNPDEHTGVSPDVTVPDGFAFDDDVFERNVPAAAGAGEQAELAEEAEASYDDGDWAEADDADEAGEDEWVEADSEADEAAEADPDDTVAAEADAEWTDEAAEPAADADGWAAAGADEAADPTGPAYPTDAQTESFSDDFVQQANEHAPMHSVMVEDFGTNAQDVLATQDAADVQAALTSLDQLPLALPHPLPVARTVEAPRATALFLDAFFAELERCGVRNVVVSPGSRSTSLAFKAYERFGDVYIDVDERGAAFFALGLAKATGNAVAVICTSGTAVGNWMPAVLEAESSRVPLLFLSADRPPRLQQIGANQTCDQLHMFGSHVKRFYQMPLPSGDDKRIAYARQIAADACLAAYGSMPGAASADGGPVHINFPFDEPLLPSYTENLPQPSALPPTVAAGQVLVARDAEGIARTIRGKRTLAICGEGTVNNLAEASAVLEFARRYQVPLLADPLSGLRSYNEHMVIDAYDAMYRAGEALVPQVVIRFGRWPVSKACMQAIEAAKPLHIAVDLRDSRDATASTTMMVRTTPAAFAQGMVDAANRAAAAAAASAPVAPEVPGADAAAPVAAPATAAAPAPTHLADAFFAQEWVSRNEAARARIAAVRDARTDPFEGSYVDKLIELQPADSLLFVGNSMSIRAVDTFYRKSAKKLTVLCNRGLAGIDGTLSSGIGAAQAFAHTTILLGDLAFLHDCNALALQGELFKRARNGSAELPCICIVVLNNQGGAIFDVLPQKSTDPYFERLFLTPQQMNIKQLAAAFGVGYRRVQNLREFKNAFTVAHREAGIFVIDVQLPLQGVAARYAPYWGA